MASGLDVEIRPEPADLHQASSGLDLVRERDAQDDAAVAAQEGHLRRALDDAAAQRAEPGARERGRGDAEDLRHVQRELPLALLAALREHEGPVAVSQDEIAR